MDLLENQIHRKTNFKLIVPLNILGSKFESSFRLKSKRSKLLKSANVLEPSQSNELLEMRKLFKFVRFLNVDSSKEIKLFELKSKSSKEVSPLSIVDGIVHNELFKRQIDIKFVKPLNASASIAAIFDELAFIVD